MCAPHDGSTVEARCRLVLCSQQSAALTGVRRIDAQARSPAAGTGVDEIPDATSAATFPMHHES